MRRTTATQHVRDVRSGTLSCEESMARILEQIDKYEQGLHAYISLNERALDQAKEIDRKIKSGENPGRCPGLPVSVKDNICVRGTKTTCASRMLEDFVAPYDATVVSRLTSQGAIITGKTNLDEFAMGLTTEFSAYGPSKNPWNPDYVPGGSSGGAAAAVSAMECTAALGSDTGGSVRNPASFCGVVGFKPTYGLLSRYGLVSYANSIEQVGPITSTVEDAALLLDVMAGRDECDHTTIDAKKDYLTGIDAGVEGKKIGIVRQMMGEGVSPSVAAIAKRAVSAMEHLGASCVEIDLGSVEYSVAAYYTITSTEAGSNLARYDNIRYGYELDSGGYEFNSYISKARTRFGPEVTRRLILGGFVPSAGHAGRYYLKALKVREMLAREVREAFGQVDLMLSPTVPVPPFRFGAKIDDPISLFLVDSNTVTANLAGIPAVSIPFGVSDGLPVGVQLMAGAMKDAQLLQAAYALQGKADVPEVPL